MTDATGTTTPRRSGWAAALLWLALVALLGGLAWLVLAGCGLAWPDGRPVLSYCPPPPERDPRLAVLEREEARQDELEDRAHALRLVLIDAPACEPPEPPSEPPEPPEPEVAEEPPPEPEPPVEVAELPPEPPFTPPPPAERPTPPPAPPPPPQPEPAAEPEPEPEPAPEPPPPVAQQPPPPPPPVGPVHRCNQDIGAAGRHDDRRVINLGTRGGLVVISFNMYRVPDHIEVRYHGRLLASTPGMVSGRHTLSFFFTPENNDPYVEVIVISNRMFPTRWVYRVNCPR